ncbi:hypothetical protein QFZ70_003562 [Arthrobacter sp. V1I9]|uniref:hypothetical protein n=1 Tax=Arthrobacter sp. V1I9 TaxID=3042275 RepID=UPI002790E535|nr:hypothetical protein [Arthrobacter sp. V1I9]MDQ0871089.1 hypothetical protein [Arthrobacter sp. V1I9]
MTGEGGNMYTFIGSIAPTDPSKAPPGGTELASVRGVAKEWLAATMALFGLLSFSGLFFGAETLKTFEDQDIELAWRFAGFLSLAVGSAAGCTFFGTRAAHGWPPRFVKAKRQDETQRKSPRSAQQKIDQARMDLKVAMGLAGLAVLMILLTVLFVLFTQLEKPVPVTVQVFAPGEIENVLVCGKYASANADGISVTKPDGGLVINPWTEVGKVTAVKSC